MIYFVDPNNNIRRTTDEAFIPEGSTIFHSLEDYNKAIDNRRESFKPLHDKLEAERLEQIKAHYTGLRQAGIPEALARSLSNYQGN